MAGVPSVGRRGPYPQIVPRQPPPKSANERLQDARAQEAARARARGPQGTATTRGGGGATRGAPTNQAVQGCPLNQPCDVLQLQLSVSTRRPPVKTTVVLRNQRITGPSAEPLRRADFVIDAFSGYPEAEGALATIHVDASFLTCPQSRHGLVSWGVQGGRSEAVVRPGQPRIQFDIPNVYAPRFRFLDAPGNGEAVQLFALLTLLLAAFEPREVFVLARACGRRYPLTGTPNHELNGLVRLFRRDKWSFTLNIPPLGQFKDSRERNAGLGGYRKATASRSSSLGGNSSAVSLEVENDRGTVNGVFKETRWRDGRGRQYDRNTSTTNGLSQTSSSQQNSHAPGWRESHSNRGSEIVVPSHPQPVADRLTRAAGFSVEIKKNDQGVDVAKTFESIKKGIDAVANAISNVRGFFRRLPQVGWKFDFDVSVFAGSVGLEIAPYTAPVRHTRHYPIEMRGIIRVALTIIKLSMELSFGIDAQLLQTGVVIRLSGKLTLEAGVRFNFPVDSLAHDSFHVDITAQGTCELNATAEVNALGYTLIGGRVGITSGLELKDGAIDIKTRPATFRLSGVVRTKPIVVQGTLTSPGKDPRPIGPRTLLEAHVLHTFGARPHR